MENSCQPAYILYSSRYGSVFQCRQCEYLQIEFGNFIIGYTPEALRWFSQLINSIDLGNEDLLHEHLQRPFVVQPVYSSGYYCFSHEEILDLRDLLTGTLAMLVLDQFLIQHHFKDPTE